MIKIISDTGCDLRRDIANELNIDLLNIILINDDKELKEDIDINAEQMFENQKKGLIYKTSQISTFNYLNKFEEYAKNNQEFIYISLSSGLSGGYNNSVLAINELKQKYPKLNMISIDSKSASVGLGLINYYSGLAAKNGMPFKELLKFIEFLIENIKHIFTVYDIKYLYESGRISKTTKSIGGLLSIRPIIEMNKEGKLTIRELTRGDKSSLKKIIANICRDTENRDMSNDIMIIIYGERMQILEDFKNKLNENKIENLFSKKVGCVIGAHTGPNIIGAGYLKKEIPLEFRGYLK